MMGEGGWGGGLGRGVAWGNTKCGGVSVGHGVGGFGGLVLGHCVALRGFCGSQNGGEIWGGWSWGTP